MKKLLRAAPDSRPARGPRAVSGAVSRAVPTVMLATLLALVACTSPRPAGEDPAPTEAATGAALADELRPVQDVWVWERVQTLTNDGDLRDLTSDLLEGLHPDEGAAVELRPGVTFTPVPGLQAALADDPTTVRDDVEVVAGILDNGRVRGLQIIATPLGDRHIQADDLLLLDLTHTGLDPGAPLIVDYAFGQGLPGAGDDQTGAELLRTRMSSDRFHWYGKDFDGTLQPGIQRVLGAVPDPSAVQNIRAEAPGEIRRAFHEEGTGPLILPVSGGNLGGIPAKADPALKPVGDLANCKKLPLRCLSEYFDSMADGVQNVLNDLFDRNDPPKDPPPDCYSCGKKDGEPHLRTFDGRAYDLQLVGEFRLAASPALTVQTRTAPWHTSDSVSVVRAVALEVGGHRITAEAGRDPVVMIDGEGVDLDAGVELAGVDVHLYARNLVVKGPDEAQVIVSGLFGTYFGVYVDPGTSKEWTGLLGDADGDPSNDFQVRGGAALGADPTLEEIHGTFGHSWRITDEESVFDYRPGQSTASFTDLEFPARLLELTDLPEPERQSAETICRQAGLTDPDTLAGCIFDLVVTGDISFVRDALFSQTLTQRRATHSQQRGAEWFRALPGAEAWTSPPVLDEAGNVLLAYSAGEDMIVAAHDLATGSPAWEQRGLACLAATSAGLVGLTTAQEWVRLDPADGTPEVLGSSEHSCTSLTGAGTSALLRSGNTVEGFDAATSAVSFTVEVEGLAHDPVPAGNQHAWLVTNGDRLSAQLLDLTTGATTTFPLPGDTSTAITTAGEDLIVSFGAGEEGGIVRISPAGHTVFTTDLPREHRQEEFAPLTGTVLGAESTYLAGYAGDAVVQVFDAATGEPVQMFRASSFNNNRGSLLLADSRVVVGPFGGKAWVEAYDAATGELTASRSAPTELSEGVNDAKHFGPLTPAGGVLVRTTQKDGLVVGLLDLD